MSDDERHDDTHRRRRDKHEAYLLSEFAPARDRRDTELDQRVADDPHDDAKCRGRGGDLTVLGEAAERDGYRVGVGES